MKVKRLLVLMFLISATIVFADEGAMSMPEYKIKDGIKAAISIADGRVDLMLVEEKTGNIIKGAKVLAKITFPDGMTVEKELMEMKMNDVYSYMNTMETSRKGKYAFNIIAEYGKRKTMFDFILEIK